MTGQVFLTVCVALSLAALSASVALTVLRIAIGPTVADRLLGLYMLLLASGGLAVIAGVKTGAFAYIDLVLVLAVAALLCMTAGARLIAAIPRAGGDDEDAAAS